MIKEQVLKNTKSGGEININKKLSAGLGILVLIIGVFSMASEHSAQAYSTKSVFTIRGYAHMTIQNGLVIQGQGFTLKHPINTINPVAIQHQTNANIQLLLWDKLGSTQQKHVILYFNPFGTPGVIKNSDTYLRFDSGKMLQIVDPHQIFSKATITTSNNGNYITINYNIMFSKQVPQSDLGIYAWDQSKYAEFTQVLKALTVT